MGQGTGHIDHDVAAYMRDHGYDLRAYLAKNWATVGPKLVDKVHVDVGDMDNYYLNLAVYDLQAFRFSDESARDRRLPVRSPGKGSRLVPHDRRRHAARDGRVHHEARARRRKCGELEVLTQSRVRTPHQSSYSTVKTVIIPVCKCSAM